MKFSSLILCYLYLILLPSSVWGNNSAQPYIDNPIVVSEIADKDWENATDGLDYGKDIAPKKPKKTNTNVDLSFLGPLFKVLLILGVVAVILLLLRYFVGVQGVQRATNKSFDPNATIDTETIADRLHDFDLPTLIQQAIDQKEYTIATRLYYLLAIKTLSEKELIQWKKDKTNRNYINELVETSLKNKFRAVTNIFERVWYGEAALNEMSFRTIQGQFLQFIQTTKSL